MYVLLAQNKIKTLADNYDVSGQLLLPPLSKWTVQGSGIPIMMGVVSGI